MEGLYLIHLVIAYKYTYNKKYINIGKKKLKGSSAIYSNDYL